MEGSFGLARSLKYLMVRLKEWRDQSAFLRQKVDGGELQSLFARLVFPSVCRQGPLSID